jgi:hypothetical protein
VSFVRCAFGVINTEVAACARKNAKPCEESAGGRSPASARLLHPPAQGFGRARTIHNSIFKKTPGKKKRDNLSRFVFLSSLLTMRK